MQIVWFELMRAAFQSVLSLAFEIPSMLPHDPFHIYRASELLSDAVAFACLTMLISTVISSVAVVVVTRSFLAFLREQKK